MTELRIEPYEIPAADLGPENPLPSFRGDRDHTDFGAGVGIPETESRYWGWNCAPRVLPHRLQDSYDRRRASRTFRSAVIENEFLCATVVPELGGRMMSLIHKPSGRELLERNPVFQPANLGLRDAWFSGGIEWNAGYAGHHHLTCSPVFTARVDGADGEPALRIYEWDRINGFTWQVDLILPSNSQVLFARGRIVNPHDHEIPMWWWTNMGVTEAPGVRMLVPADSMVGGTAAGFGALTAPIADGYDTSYPAKAHFAKEYFYRIPKGRRPWMASVDSSGCGIFETSTARLQGRKQFDWGTNAGGRNWQDYLSIPGHAYYEIQAGLARTQLECVPMPANTEWDWTEAFGLIELDPSDAHSEDWSRATASAEDAIQQAIPSARLDALHESFDAITRRTPTEILAEGSGWGALERFRLAHQDQSDRIPAELVFPRSTLGHEQQGWMALLESGKLPERDPLSEPLQGMIQREWRDILQQSADAGDSDHWLAWLHLGNMRMETREVSSARLAWRKSHELVPNAWALRNLAVIETRGERHEAALDLLRQAWEIGPKIAPLAIEYGRAMVRLEKYEDLLEFTQSLPADVASHERLRMMAAEAQIKLGCAESLDEFFSSDFANIREGEVSLTELWFSYHEQRVSKEEGIPIDDALRQRVRRDFPPPRGIDFRMTAEA